MKTILIIIQLLFVLPNLKAQDCNFLDSRQGFRTIKLESDIIDYADFIKKDKNNESLFKNSIRKDAAYVYVPREGEKIGTAAILYIYLVTDKGKISEIIVVTQKVMSVYYILKSAYGEPQSVSGNSWTWTGRNVSCTVAGDDSALPGCYITYKNLHSLHDSVRRLKEKSVLEAQQQL